MYIEKVDIGSVNFSKKTIHHIEKLFLKNLDTIKYLAEEMSWILLY